jgi:hypothetical protein
MLPMDNQELVYTSDGLKQYKKVAENLGLKHQRSVFHIMKDCREKVKR